MKHLGFVSYKAGRDIWMRTAVRDNGDENWEYLLLYVDDDLACVSQNGTHVLEEELGKYFM